MVNAITMELALIDLSRDVGYNFLARGVNDLFVITSLQKWVANSTWIEYSNYEQA